MADYATINTPRYRVRYRTQGQSHAITFRIGRDTVNGPLAGRELAQDVLNAMAPWRFDDWAVLGAEYAGADSELFFPAAPPILVPGEATANNPAQKVVFASFQGRSIEGARASFYIYGINSDPVGGAAAEHDFRYTAEEFPVVGAVLDALADHGGDVVAIDNAAVFWNQYANIGYNAYYQRQQRG